MPTGCGAAAGAAACITGSSTGDSATRPARGLADSLRRRVVGVHSTSGVPPSDVARSGIVSGTAASSGTSSSSASAWPPPSPKIGKRSPPGS